MPINNKLIQLKSKRESSKLTYVLLIPHLEVHTIYGVLYEKQVIAVLSISSLFERLISTLNSSQTDSYPNMSKPMTAKVLSLLAPSRFVMRLEI